MSDETHTSRGIYTLDIFGQRNPAFPPTVMRNLLWRSRDRHSSIGTIKGNGLDVAVLRIGRRIYIDEAKFFLWLEGKREGTHSDS